MIRRASMHALGNFSHALRFRCTIKRTRRLFSQQPSDATRHNAAIQAAISKSDEARSFFDNMAREFSINGVTGWYDVSRADIISRGGRRFLYQNEDSVSKCLKAIYPEYNWEPWKFKQIYNGYWADKTNHLAFLESLAKKLDIKTMEDWYRVQKKDIIEHGGRGLLGHFRGSPRLLLSQSFPNHTWHQWRFCSGGRAIWANHADRRAFFDWAGKQLGVHELVDWYTVVAEDVIELGGSRLLRGSSTSSSLAAALQDAYPEHKWSYELFATKNGALLSDPASQREWFVSASEKLFGSRIQPPVGMDKWYTVKSKDVLRLQGASFITHSFNGQLAKAIMSAFPEHDWQEWKFVKAPAGFWRSFANQRRFLESTLPQLKQSGSMESLHSLSKRDIEEIGGHRMLQLHDNSVTRMLARVFPEHQWQDSNFVEK